MLIIVVWRYTWCNMLVRTLAITPDHSYQAFILLFKSLQLKCDFNSFGNVDMNKNMLQIYGGVYWMKQFYIRISWSGSYPYYDTDRFLIKYLTLEFSFYLIFLQPESLNDQEVYSTTFCWRNWPVFNFYRGDDSLRLTWVEWLLTSIAM